MPVGCPVSAPPGQNVNRVEVSDTPIENEVSQAVHRKLGFAVTERVVYFNKSLKSMNAALPGVPAAEGGVGLSVGRSI